MKIATILPGYPLSGECRVLDELTVESVAERIGYAPQRVALIGHTIHVHGRAYATIRDFDVVPENIVGAWTPEDRARVRGEAEIVAARVRAREQGNGGGNGGNPNR